MSAPRSRAARRRPISVGSPDGSGSSVAVLQSAKATPSATRGAVASPSRRPPWATSSVPPAHAWSTSMRFSVRVPVLSVQMTLVAPRVSTALRRFTSAPPRARRRTPTASASVIVGSRPSGTFATSSPIGEHDRVGERQPGERADRDERDRGDHGDHRDEPRDAADLALQRAVVVARALRERGDAAQLGGHAGRRDDRAGIAAGAARAAEDEVARVERRDEAVVEVRRAEDGDGLAVEGRQVHLDRALEQPGVRADAVSLLHHEQVAGHERRGVDVLLAPVAHDPRVRREVRLERLDGALGVTLLREREGCVERDHHQDRDRQLHEAADGGERGGGEQQQRERVRQLGRELPGPGRPASAAQLVGPVLLESPRGLTRRQPGAVAVQIAQELTELLRRVRSRWGGWRRHDPTRFAVRPRGHIGGGPRRRCGGLRMTRTARRENLTRL